MDQVKYLKLEKNLKNGTVRTHGPAGKYHKEKNQNYGHIKEDNTHCYVVVDRLVLINLAT